MKLLVVAALVAVAAAAQAEPASRTLEQKYLAARDAYIKRFSAKKWPTPEELKRITALEEPALRDLETHMRAIVGPLALKGMPPEGKINIEALQRGDMGFGQLDGMAYRSADEKTSIVVTTRGLLATWLKAHQKVERVFKLPSAPEAAFRVERFYTQSLSTDAAVVRFADLPLGIAGAHAFLGGRTQDSTPEAANEVFVAGLRGAHVMVAAATLTPPLSIEACLAPRVAAEKALQDNPKPGEDSEAASNKIAREFKRCFAERAPKEPRWAEAMKLAKDLLETVPER